MTALCMINASFRKEERPHKKAMKASGRLYADSLYDTDAHGAAFAYFLN
ncbi:hypothetical protein NSA40_09545 [[Clostridium] innocuum]|nr:hypothetical protein [[Clostridium] innocuum]MBV4342625.1 hypothetical protein [Erysipelatoclostridium sp. DFI.2.3]MCC2827640.1 hypothetical protein [[Clostridium] innocuum]MCG4495940.1 hypothetical protein [[Clostridium] innocuum]MCQ4708613.1 hypothetical protein [[Clostridium] innocuum]MCR0228762.1 hypothetical protein [[Clostridium] innocuum]